MKNKHKKNFSVSAQVCLAEALIALMEHTTMETHSY